MTEEEINKIQKEIEDLLDLIKTRKYSKAYIVYTTLHRKMEKLRLATLKKDRV